MATSVTADDIIRAFVTRSATDGSHVTFAERSAPNGYVRVYGPNADVRDSSKCCVIVERANGAVSVTKELKPHLVVRDRPDPPLAIHDDPAGFSSGPKYGRYDWTMIIDDASSASEVVDKIIR